MEQPKKDLLIGMFLFILEILLFYYLWHNNLELTVSIIILSAIVLFLWTDRQEKLMYLTGFILGPIVDLILVPTGIWSYGNPTTFGVPIWLAPSYGLYLVIFIKIGKSAAKLFSK